ncbi:sigma factor [Bradyrhizobium sp. Arg314]
MTKGEQPPNANRRAELLDLAGELRPELHRYCSRLMGSVIEGEDVVQDTLAKALVALDGLVEPPLLRAWLKSRHRCLRVAGRQRPPYRDASCLRGRGEKEQGMLELGRFALSAATKCEMRRG